MREEITAVKNFVEVITKKELIKKEDLQVIFQMEIEDFINYLFTGLHDVLSEKASTEVEKDTIRWNKFSNIKNNMLVSKEIKNSSNDIEKDEIKQIETICSFYKQILEKKEIDKDILKMIYFIDRETLLCFISACMPMEFTGSKDNEKDIKNLNIISDAKKLIRVNY